MGTSNTKVAPEDSNIEAFLKQNSQRQKESFQLREMIERLHDEFDRTFDPEKLFTVDALGSELRLDVSTTDYLRSVLPENDQEVYMVLKYQPEFANRENFEANKKVLLNALVDLGGVMIGDNVLKFSDWDTLYKTIRQKIRDQMPGYFYFPFAHSPQVFSTEPTIKSIPIIWDLENPGKLRIPIYNYTDFFTIL